MASQALTPRHLLHACFNHLILKTLPVSVDCPLSNARSTCKVLFVKHFIMVESVLFLLNSQMTDLS